VRPPTAETHIHTHTQIMSALEIMTEAAEKASVVAETTLLRNWAGQIGKWCEEHPGEQPTEEVLTGLFGLKAAGGKGRGRPKGSTSEKVGKQVEAQCCAAKYAFSGGKYENARCKKGGCDRDDGRGNLLCDKCGTAWDTVSQVMMAGVAISYGSDKGHAGGAPWAGIWAEDWATSDVPPVFEGQRCHMSNEDGKWNVNKSFALLKKENNGASWHKPGDTWALEGEAAASPRAELSEDTSAPADEGEAAEELVEHEGLSYAKAEHDGETYFYARFGEEQAPSTDPDAYAAAEEDGVWEWANGEAKEAHKEAMA
jgi:hypothetical protein